MATFPVTATVAGCGRRGFVDGHTARDVYFDSPLELCLLPDHRILLSDGRNNCLRLLDLPRQTVQTVSTHSFLGVRSPVLIDGGAAVVVSDSGHNKLRMLQIRPTADGSLDVEDCTIAGTGRAALVDGPAESACFSRPTGLCVHSDGSILVADTGNHCIRRIAAKPGRPGLQVTTIAGSGHAGFTDGRGPEASFSGPCALSVTPDGSAVVVSDAGNHALRVLHGPTDSSPLWTVTALLGGQPGFEDGVCTHAAVREPSCLAVLPQADLQGKSALLLSDAANNAIRSFSALSVSEMASSEVPALVGMSADGQVGFVDLQEAAVVAGAQDKVVAVLPGSSAREGLGRGQHNRTIVVSPALLRAVSLNSDSDSRRASESILQAATQVARAHATHTLPTPTVLVHPNPITVLLTHMRLGKVETVAGASPSLLSAMSPNGTSSPHTVQGNTASSVLASAASAAGLQHVLASLKRYEDGPSVITARFKRPAGLCVLPEQEGARSVLVADSGNHFIRVLLSSKALTAPTCPPILLHVLTPGVLAQGLAELERSHEDAVRTRGERGHARLQKTGRDVAPTRQALSAPQANSTNGRSPVAAEAARIAPAVSATSLPVTLPAPTPVCVPAAQSTNVGPVQAQKLPSQPSRASLRYEGIGSMTTAELLAVIDAQQGEDHHADRHGPPARIQALSPPTATASDAIRGTAPVQSPPPAIVSAPPSKTDVSAPAAALVQASRRSSVSSLGSRKSGGSRRGSVQEAPLAVSALQHVSTRRLSIQAMQSRVPRAAGSAPYMANTDSRARASLHLPSYLQSQRLIRQAYATGVTITSPRVARRVQQADHATSHGGAADVSLLELAESQLDLHEEDAEGESKQHGGTGSVAGMGHHTPALEMLSNLNAAVESRHERLQPRAVHARGSYTAKVGSAESFAQEHHGGHGMFRLAAGVGASASGSMANKSALERSKDPVGAGLLAAHALVQSGGSSSRSTALDVNSMTADPDVLLNVSAALVDSSMNRSPSKRVQIRKVEQTIVPVLPAVLVPEASSLAHASRVSKHSMASSMLQPGAIKTSGKPGLAGMQMSAEQASKHPGSTYGSRDALAAEEMDASGALVRALLLSGNKAGDTPQTLVTKRFVRHTLSSVSRVRDNGNAAPLTAPAFVNVPKLVSKKVTELKARAAEEAGRSSVGDSQGADGGSGSARSGTGRGQRIVDVASLITRTVSPHREMLAGDNRFVPSSSSQSREADSSANGLEPLARSTVTQPGPALRQGSTSASGVPHGGESVAMDASFDVVRALHPTFRSRRPSTFQRAVAANSSFAAGTGVNSSALKQTGRETMLKEIPAYAIMRE